MVEQVEELSPEVYRHSLAIWQQEVFDQGKIGVDKVRAIKRRARGIPEFPIRCADEALRVEPFIQGPAAASGTDLVWTVKVVSIVGKIHAGTIVAVDQEHRKSRRN